MGSYADKDGIFDDFWDLASMTAKKRRPSPKASPASKPSLADVRTSTREDACMETVALPPIAPLTPLIEYKPKSPFLQTVRLLSKPKGYSFYSNFLDDAKYYFGRVAPKCEPVPYFSYIPQYAQMNKEQRNFYFYFRSCAQAGEFIACDITYVWLYIYEIINLPDLIPPKEGVISLCRLWKAYRPKNPKMDKYMTVWLADYCLVHQLPCPYEWIKDFLPAIMENAGFKEFYLGRAAEMNEYGVHTLLSLISPYDMQKSRFLQALDRENKGKMLCALVPVLKRHLAKDSSASQSEALSVLTRDAFTGSLCAQNLKYRIEVTYRSFSHSAALSEAITAALKYAENKMRILCKQKSRVSVSGLLAQDQADIDAYFERITPKKERRVEVPAYEKLYDAQSTGISFADARQIETASWENTRRLTVEEEIPAPLPKEKESVQAVADEAPFTEAELLLLCKLLEGNLPAPDFDTVALAESVNEKATELMGDIVIEWTDDVMRLIEDYREDVQSWVPKP